MSRPFASLSPREVLGLAIAVERANAGRFRAFADAFRGDDAEVTTRFDELAREETEHEKLLVARFHDCFTGEIPVMTEQEVNGVVESADLDDAEHLMFDSLPPARVYQLGLDAEQRAQRFCRLALVDCTDDRLASLYRDLAAMEDGHAD